MKEVGERLAKASGVDKALASYQSEEGLNKLQINKKKIENMLKSKSRNRKRTNLANKKLK